MKGWLKGTRTLSFPRCYQLLPVVNWTQQSEKRDFIENKAIHAISKINLRLRENSLFWLWQTYIQEKKKKRPSGGRGCRGCWSSSAPGCSSVPGLSSCWHGQLSSDNPWIRLTSRGRAATGSQGSRAHKRSHWRLAEGARQSIRVRSALRCRHHKAKTLTFCLLFIQLLCL